MSEVMPPRDFTLLKQAMLSVGLVFLMSVSGKLMAEGVGMSPEEAQQLYQFQFTQSLIRIQNEIDHPRPFQIPQGRAVRVALTGAGAAFKVGRRALPPVVIFEFSDFQCPRCKDGNLRIHELMKKYPGKIAVLHRNFPLVTIHAHSMVAARYFEAIARVNPLKAYLFSDEVFENQDDFSKKGAGVLDKLVTKLGIDLAKVKHGAASPGVSQHIQEDMAEGSNVYHLTGTPAFVINGVLVDGVYPENVFEQVIDGILSKNKGHGKR